jgi:anthranilate/para-aminobenzoate synthase component II
MFSAMRTIGGSFPVGLFCTAWDETESLIMGIRHPIYLVFGIQFHPESVGSPLGSVIISSFISQKAVLVDVILAKTQVRRP